MGDLVRLEDFRRPTETVPASNAREALMGTILSVPAITTIFSVTEFVDFLLVSLWASGFQLVPITPPDDAA